MDNTHTLNSITIEQIIPNSQSMITIPAASNVQDALKVISTFHFYFLFVKLGSYNTCFLGLVLI